MKVYALDTHTLVQLADDTLSAARKALLQGSSAPIVVSQMSLWELSKLIELGRVVPEGESPLHYLRRFEGHPRLRIEGLTAEVLARTIEIAPQMHKDPADQVIVATALVHKAVLLTNDTKIRSLDWLETA